MNGRHKSNIKPNYLLPFAFISILGKFRFRLNRLCFCHTSERKNDICLITGKEKLRKECRLTRKEFLNCILEANCTKRQKGLEFLYGNIVCMESLWITIITGMRWSGCCSKSLFFLVPQFSFFKGKVVSQVCTLVIWGSANFLHNFALPLDWNVYHNVNCLSFVFRCRPLVPPQALIM